MKLFHTIISSVAALAIFAGHASADVRFSDVRLDHSASSLVAEMSVDGSALELKSNEEVVVTPLILFKNGEKIALTPVVFAGHNRYIQAQRNPSKFKDMILAQKGQNVNISKIVDYEDWMSEGELSALVEHRGCCRRPEGEESMEIQKFLFPGEWKFEPRFLFRTPEAEGVKMRELSGKAFVDYRVNRTEIDPLYRQNARELGVIYATIDSIVSDSDVKLKAISFTGYASPEGPYDNNVRLAKGRTASLCDFVRNLYKFPESALTTNSVPEDWDGLRRAIENSSFPNKTALLEVINDTSLEPDARDRRLATRFPAEYKVILADIYPALRHCDYTVNFEVRTFDDPAKILELVETAPQKLSLREMFVAANTLEPGSEQYCRVFETAARMFPKSEVANLNAAVSELQRGSYEQARYFLSRSGDQPLAVYTRGILAAFDGDFDQARTLLNQALEAGVPEAEDALKQINDK